MFIYSDIFYITIDQIEAFILNFDDIGKKTQIYLKKKKHIY